MPRQLKIIIYKFFKLSDSTNFYSFADQIITWLIFLNITVFIASTSSSFSPEYKPLFEYIEIICSLVFTIEYILRLWACTITTKYKHPIWGRLKYALTPLSIIDFLSTLPVYLLLLFPQFVFINLISLLRLLRLIKMSRYSDSMQSLGTVLCAKKDELIATAFAVFIILIFASTLMYFLESEAHPQAFGSIPDAMWWGVITLTTVGYGDIYPITPLGKFLGSILAFLGIGLFALPAGIISSGFSEEIQRKKQGKMADNLAKSKNFQSVETLLGIEVGFEQKLIAIALHVENSSELMKLCVEKTKQKLGSHIENEEVLRDFAIHLYNETVRKFEL